MKKTIRSMGVSLVMLGIMGGAGHLRAANPWLTGRTVDDQTEPISWYKLVDPTETQEAFDETVQKAARMPGIRGQVKVTGGAIDLVISLTDEKDGDDDGNNQGGVDNAEQDRVERIIQHCADAVYEMTEGAHRLRNVRIFQNSEQEADCDILWGDEGIPGANVSGDSLPGGRIWMYDKDKRSTFSYTDRKAGYTIAHELGHYLYGLYDEYKIGFFDKPVHRSVMNNQFEADNQNDWGWLNFSIAYQADNSDGDWVNTKRTEQHSERGASAWETLSRPASDDPWGLADLFKSRGVRTYFPELAAVAPSGTDEPVINHPDGPWDNNPNPAARQILNILWTDPEFVTVLVLDRSGSMNSTMMANMKQAAIHLLDVVPVGSSVGIVSFASSALTDAAIREIQSDADRTVLKTAVNNLSAGGLTALGEAAMSALNQISSHGAAGAASAVFLLTDGYGNTGAYQDLLGVVVPAFQNAQVPIMGFGYGSSVDPRLPNMATMTGGKYYSSPTDYTTIAKAFQDAFSYVSGSPVVASGTESTPAGSATKPVNIPVTIDTTIASFTVSVSYDGDPSDVDLSLFAPKSKSPISPKSVNASGGQSLWLFEVVSPQAGGWALKGTANAGMTLNYLVNAEQDGSSYALRAEIQGGTIVTSPSPMTIVAHLSRQLPIDGAKVTASVTDPNGTTTTLSLNNIGAGLYSGTYLAYSRNGTYSVVVEAENAGRARLTYEGVEISISEDGDNGGVPRDIALREKFSRASSLQATVSGVTHAPQGLVDEWTPTFLWPKDPDAIRYSLEVYNLDGKRVLRAKPRKGENSYTPKRPLPVGAYTWKVATTKVVMVPKLDKKGNPVLDRKGNPKMRKTKVTTWSALFSFTRAANVPGAVTKIAPDGEEFAGDVYLWWQEDPAATSYSIILQQKNRDGVTFNKGKRIRLLLKDVGVDRYLVKRMKPGEYRWFIQAESPDGAGPEDASGMEFEVKAP